jgi:hypothetical protein
MSEEQKPNWALAIFTMVLVVGALIALAIPSLRMIGGLILFGYWYAICAGSSYAWYGASKFDVWALLALALVAFLAGAFLWHTPAGVFWLSFGAVNLVHAWWRNRRLKENPVSSE